MTSSEKRAIALILGILIFALAAAFAVLGGFFLAGRLADERNAELVDTKSELYVAVSSGDYEKVEAILSRRPEAVNEARAENPTEYGKAMNDDTLLIAAGDDVKMIELLIEHGADVNKPTPITSRYPITQVLAGGGKNRFEAAWVYVNNGADLCVTDAEAGSVPVAIASVFIENGAENALLQLSAKDLMEYAVNSGASLKIESATDYEVTNVFGLAIENNLYMTAEYFVTADIFSPNTRVTADGRTPLIEAICCTRVDITDMLLENGADPYVSDNNGKNAFYYLLHLPEGNLVREAVEKYKAGGGAK